MLASNKIYANLSKSGRDITKTGRPKPSGCTLCVRTSLSWLFSIRLFLVLCFLVLIGVICGSWFIIINKTQYDSSTELSTAFRSEAIQRILKHMEAYMKPLPIVAKNVADVLSSGAIDWYGNRTLADRIVFMNSKANPYITALYYVTGTPRRNSGYFYLQGMYLYVGYWTETTENGSPVALADPETGAYDLSPEAQVMVLEWTVPMDLAWYRKAVSIQNVGWSAPYFESLFPGELWISAFGAIRSFENNTIIGYTGCDYSLAALNTYLENTVKISATGFVYIIEMNGDLVADSSSADPSYITLDSGEAVKINVFSHNNTHFLYSAQAIKKAHGDLSNIPNDKVFQLSFLESQEVHLVQYAVFHDEFGLDLLVVAVAPESEFLAPLYQIRWILAIITVVTIIIALVVAVTVALCITVPLSVLGTEMNKISNLNIEGGKIKRAVRSFHEVHSLQSKFNRMKSALISFGKYVPKEVVKLLLADGGEATIGLRETELTVFFSDIAGFTTISEKLQPEKLVILVEKYFSIVSNIILESEGTIDKYIGDAVMAFWNAPKKVTNHSYKAVKAALTIQSKLNSLQYFWESNGFPVIHTRIGLNYGQAYVGNLGCDYRINYTAIGDNINLASRLEGLNKEYGTSLMISDSLYNIIKDQFICRPLDKVVVVGKQLPTTVYEVIADAAEVLPEMKQLTELYCKAYEFYLSRNFAQAKTLFEKYEEKKPKEKAVLTMIERCVEYIETPPPVTWDASTVLTHK